MVPEGSFHDRLTWFIAFTASNSPGTPGTGVGVAACVTVGLGVAACVAVGLDIAACVAVGLGVAACVAVGYQGGLSTVYLKPFWMLSPY